MVFVNICDPDSAAGIDTDLSMLHAQDMNTRVNGGLDMADLLLDSYKVSQWQQYARSQVALADAPGRSTRWAEANTAAMQYCEQNTDQLGGVVVSSHSLGDGSLLDRLCKMIVDLNCGGWMRRGLTN